MSILFPYFELAASLFILLLCFRIFTRHYENKVARFFAFFALVAFLAAIFEYSVRIAFTLELARNLDRITGTLWAFLFPIFSHFSFLYTGKKRFLESPFSYVFFYLPPSILAFLFIFTNLMNARYEIMSFGIVSQPAILFWLFLSSSAFYSLLGIVLILNFAAKAQQKTERAQAILIAIGSLIPVSVGLITDGVLPIIFGVRVVFPTVVFGVALMNLFIYIAMRRYSLFAVSPALAADVIIETMPNALLATDFEGKILFVNDEASRLFSVSQEELIGRKISSLFKVRERYDQLYNEVANKRKEILRFEAELVDPLGQRIPASINANLLKDKVVGDVIGIIFVIRDTRG
jgi:PAS domain S-box-containing protein